MIHRSKWSHLHSKICYGPIDMIDIYTMFNKHGCHLQERKEHSVHCKTCAIANKNRSFLQLLPNVYEVNNYLRTCFFSTHYFQKRLDIRWTEKVGPNNAICTFCPLTNKFQVDCGGATGKNAMAWAILFKFSKNFLLYGHVCACSLYNHINIAEGFIIKNSCEKQQSFFGLLLCHVPFLNMILQICFYSINPG
uniref:Uncharacterized protein MANES_03G197400 n=1 Tax=Rhizophora mucronata TaxID=61149 RepID=A0A2P2LIH3_RHIMU